VTAFFPLQSTFTAVFAFAFLHQPPTAADLAGLAAVTAARAARSDARPPSPSRSQPEATKRRRAKPPRVDP